MILTNKVRDLSGSGSKINADSLCSSQSKNEHDPSLSFQTRRKENGRAKHPRETLQVTTRMIIIILSDHQPVRATLPRKLTAIRRRKENKEKRGEKKLINRKNDGDWKGRCSIRDRIVDLLTDLMTSLDVFRK